LNNLIPKNPTKSKLNIKKKLGQVHGIVGKPLTNGISWM
jgi:hypothetical protein